MASTLNVSDGDEILAGTQLAQGYLDPKEVLKIKGLIDGQRYVILEAQKVYESQGIGINDKHFEVVLTKNVRQSYYRDKDNRKATPSTNTFRRLRTVSIITLSDIFLKIISKCLSLIPIPWDS